MWRYFGYIKFVLKFVGVSSKHLRSSSKVFGNLLKSSDIFGNFRKFSENVRERSSGPRNNFGKSSVSGRKSSENHQKRRHQHVYVIKRTLHVTSNIWILCSRDKNNISRLSAANSWDMFLALEHRINIFSPPCNILYIYLLRFIAVTSCGYKTDFNLNNIKATLCVLLLR